MAGSRIFRKVSLERLSSPEQLDQVMRITTPAGWIALSGITMILVAAIVWSVVGTLSEKIAGNGILVKSGGVLEVVASAGGQVTDVPVKAGDGIAEGQTVAWIAQPELLESFQEAKDNLRAARKRHEESVAHKRQEAELQRETLNRRRTNLEQSITADRQRLESLRERIEAQTDLVERGLLAKPVLLSTLQQRDLSQEKIRSSRSALSQIAVEETALDVQLEEAIRAGERQIAGAEQDVAQLDRQLRSTSQVVSAYTGRVLEVMTEKGRIVARGEPILSLDLSGDAIQDLVAVMYIPSIHGKKIEPGMNIHIAPTTVRREEYGMMLGRVTFVSDFPATPKGMLRVLKNEKLVYELAGGGAPYEVRAELVVAPDTPSQYAWTSSAGPPTNIQSGTVASGFITVASQRPISRVIPALRKWVGS